MLKVTKNSRIRCVLFYIAMLLLLFAQHTQLTYSSSIGLHYIWSESLRWMMINLLILCVPLLVFQILFRNLVVASAVNIGFVSLCAIINSYVVKLHGGPVLAGELLSIRTAADVLGSYHFFISAMQIRLLLIMVVEVVVWLFAWKCFFVYDEKHTVRQKAIVVLLADLMFLWGIFFAPFAVFSKSLITWSFVPAIREYGYEMVFLNNLNTAFHPYREPDGYQEWEPNVPVTEDVMSAGGASTESGLAGASELPDIFVVVNETFCNLKLCGGVEEGETILEKLSTIDNLYSGYAASSVVGGGTNNTEYELLTSNSMALLSMNAPFTYVNLKDSNSIVNYVQGLGYTTSAFHSMEPTNYSRNTAYRAIGFDYVQLGENQFTMEYYGNRRVLDRDNYADVEAYSMSGNQGPGLYYLLTFQNHGGYAQNDASFDTVHVTGDYGELTEEINEYLTSVSMSVDALTEFIDTLKQHERNTILIMVGDHAPSFITDLTAENPAFGDINLARRLVPYYVWSNYDMDMSIFREYVSLVDLMPMVLEAAGMPLSVYYECVLERQEEYPVLIGNGIVIDADGNSSVFTEHTNQSILDDYLYMEYNNLMHDEDYCADLFKADLSER